MQPSQAKSEKTWSIFFEECVNPDTQESKYLLGGKGSALANMTKLGFPVPPGFIITTDCCKAYHGNEKIFPDGMWQQVRQHIAALEMKTGKRFGDAENPLLVSVRSGSPFSMPGMMDTILNLGLNDETVIGLGRQTGDERFAWDAYRRFISLFGQIVLGIPHERFERVLEHHKNGCRTDADLTTEQLKEIVAANKRLVFGEKRRSFPEDVENQLKMAIAAVFDSWMGRRAIDYRRVHRIPDDLGTAVNVQAMVFGNLGETSGTGVCFTRNPSTGEKELYGEYLMNAQGEDVVAGIRTPLPVSTLQKQNPKIYKELVAVCNKVEKHYRDMQDMEFTIRDGVLYILQARNGKRTATAAVRVAVELVAEQVLTKAEAVMRVELN